MRKIILIIFLGAVLFSFGTATRGYAEDTTPPTFEALLYGLATPYTTQNPFGVWVYVSDDVGVTSVTWENDTGSYGTGVYNGTCYVTVIPMVEGTNNITFVASDAAGNSTDHSISINYVDPANLPAVSDPNPAQGATVVPGDSGQLLRVTAPGATSATFHYGTGTADPTSAAGTLVDDYVQVVVPYATGGFTTNGTNYWAVEVTNGYGTVRYPQSGYLSFRAAPLSQVPVLNLLLLN